MKLFRQMLKYLAPRRPLQTSKSPTGRSDLQLLTDGWERYAQDWDRNQHTVPDRQRVQHLGDEWTVEDPAVTGSSYGLPTEVVAQFNDYISQALLDPYLPTESDQGLEIGPGGGRLTALLAPRTKLLHLADSSATMLSHLKRRFAQMTHLRYHQTDGVTLPALPLDSLNYVIAFDVFVHFEPRLVYWYLRQIGSLLKPGGTGILHYANLSTPLGWRQFETHLQANLTQRTFFAAFGVMCPQVMDIFLEALRLEVVSSDLGIIPRDAVAVFRKPSDR